MEYQQLFNILAGFDFKLLNGPEFQEDSVREELIVPLLKELGYSASKPYQIIRSRRLLHPFVSIGSVRKSIYLVPDYLFEIHDQPAWILDAKAPSEAITKSAHVEQAYSYAIHPEVRAKYFALCNGREFALYSVDRLAPLLHFPLQAIPLHWGTLRQYLAPEQVLNSQPFVLRKDLGLHLKRLGFTENDVVDFLRVPVTFIAQLEPDQFTFSSSVKLDEGSYVVSFDFDPAVFEQLRERIPGEAFSRLRIRQPDSRLVMQFADRAYLLDISCQPGTELQENQDELFLPLLIRAILN